MFFGGDSRNYGCGRVINETPKAKQLVDGLLIWSSHINTCSYIYVTQYVNIVKSFLEVSLFAGQPGPLLLLRPLPQLLGDPGVLLGDPRELGLMLLAPLLNRGGVRGRRDGSLRRL